MRFLSSSALASAPKLRLAASCSAAETISSSEPPRYAPWPPCPRPFTPPRLLTGRSRERPAQGRRGVWSGGRFGRLPLGRENFDRAAGLLDRRHRRLRCPVNRNGDFRLQ